MKKLVALTGAIATGAALCMTSAAAAPSTPGDVPGPLVEESSTGSYIVVMKDDPLVVELGQDGLNTPEADQKRAAKKAKQDKTLKNAGLGQAKKTNTFTNTLDGFSVQTDLAGAERLAKQPDVATVLVDELRQPQAIADAVKAAQGDPTGVNDLNKFLGLDTGAYAKGIDGSGVIVGVIDTGIWPEQPMLADDGTYPAAPALSTKERSACDFGNRAWNKNDKPFTCNNKLIGARTFLDTYKAVSGLTKGEFDSARDSEGHGTHTATTTAGNANVQSMIFGVEKDIVSGIAPRAQIIAYKALGAGGGYTSDLSKAIDQAVADHVGVINYSIGGGARVVSADTISFLYAARAGVFAAVSAGNSGPRAKSVGGPANVPWVTAVGATTFPRNYAGQIELGNGKVYPATSITKGTGWKGIIDAANAGLPGKANPGLCIEGSLDPAKVNGMIVLCERGQNGRIAKSGEVQRAGGVGMVLFNHVDTDTMFSDNFFVPTVMMDKTPGEEIRAYANSTTGAKGKITNTGINTLPMYSPTLTYFSSRGETVPNGDIIKPDISAPGAQIMAGNTPMPDGGGAPAGELWQAIAGTSMSGPVVAGSFALLRQAHPTWTPAMAKSALMTQSFAAVRDNDRVSPATPFGTGSGMAMLGQPDAKGSSFQPGLAYDATFNDYLGFLCAEGGGILSASTCAMLASRGFATTSANLNYPSIGMKSVPGVMTVKRSVTNVSDAPITATANVTAPTGYSVTVTPSTITVAPGAKASFEITVQNTGAPVGEWRFGSLTWSGDGYDVRSPIAVRGVAIAAPATVSGQGTTGTATIPVTVGKAGTYTATPHGLVPATHSTGTVAQDPDKKYPSPDDGAGVVKVPFTLSGVDHARWRLQLPGDTDLDLYLLGPKGNIVAQSTAPGTDELIDLDRPADGTYTMVIHGWGVGDTPVAYDLRSWLVPSTSGGSLAVTSGSPTVVTAGQHVDVGIAWSGLTPGEYLGSVTHAVDGSRVGSTTVAVTTQ